VFARSTEARESREGKPDSVRSSHDGLRVALGDRRVVVAAPDAVQILDFGNGTVRGFDPNQRAVFSGSLCALWTEDLKRQAQRDERLREYRRAASGSIEKGADQAAGQGAEGRPHLETALRANPCLAGAWIDIGSGFLNDYQTYVAWECFDIARRILPAGSPTFSRVEALERDLRARHPEFF
jgi:hypothetical protein